MKEIKKIFVVGGSTGYANWLLDMGMMLTKIPENADIALFTGGADLGPELYKEKEGSRTQCYRSRDKEELYYYDLFLKKGTPMLGICRGGQLFTIMEGGKLVQHSTHPYNHKVTTKDGEVYDINSMHHQQFLLEGCSNYTLIAWAENLSPFHLDGNDVDYNFPEDYKEPEVVYFVNSKSLAIQCHPECIDNFRTMQWFKKLVREHLLVEKEELQVAA